MMLEQWRPVVGHEGLYEVSDLGNVRSVPRRIRNTRGRLYELPGVTLRPVIRSKHAYVGLYRPRRLPGIHTLALEAFVGPCPPGMEGCHNNGDGLDNRLSNLRWDTKSANSRDSVRHGTHVRTRRTHCPRRHPLVAPNLVASQAALGRRMCRACHQTHGLLGRDASPVEFRTESDRRFSLIMGGAPSSTLPIS
jgi:hypothetical protein